MPGGRKSDKLMRDAIRLALLDTNSNGDKYLHIVAKKLVQRAAEDGDVQAIKEINDRIDGKVTQPIGGDKDAPIVISWQD